MSEQLVSTLHELALEEFRSLAGSCATWRLSLERGLVKPDTDDGPVVVERARVGRPVPTWQIVGPLGHRLTSLGVRRSPTTMDEALASLAEEAVAPDVKRG